MDFKSKYNFGDKVHSYRLQATAAQETCNHCDGHGRLATNIEGYKVTCPRCTHGKKWVDDKIEWKPHYSGTLTIGQIRIRATQGKEIIREYMCAETGVGSGTLHSEASLFASKALAEEAMQELCSRLPTDISINNVKKSWYTVGEEEE